jgi:hypothetical protein
MADKKINVPPETGVSTGSGSDRVGFFEQRPRSQCATRSLPLPVLTSSPRLLNKILRARIMRRMKNLIGITALDDFSAFHVEQLIGQPFKKSD